MDKAAITITRPEGSAVTQGQWDGFCKDNGLRLLPATGKFFGGGVTAVTDRGVTVFSSWSAPERVAALCWAFADRFGIAPGEGTLVSPAAVGVFLAIPEEAAA